MIFDDFLKENINRTISAENVPSLEFTTKSYDDAHISNG